MVTYILIIYLLHALPFTFMYARGDRTFGLSDLFKKKKSAVVHNVLIVDQVGIEIPPFCKMGLTVTLS
jgi:hypothetical protein